MILQGFDGLPLIMGPYRDCTQKIWQAVCFPDEQMRLSGKIAFLPFFFLSAPGLLLSPAGEEIYFQSPENDKNLRGNESVLKP